MIDEIVRDGARRKLAAALEAEVAVYIAAHADEVYELVVIWWCATAAPSLGRWWPRGGAFEVHAPRPASALRFGAAGRGAVIDDSHRSLDRLQRNSDLAVGANCNCCGDPASIADR